jgi:predicted dinucleotide-binding enzyme
MRFGVLGTGMVGRTIATKLVDLGNEVTMGSRSAGNENASEWASAAGARASEGTFADAASAGEMVVNCTMGAGSLDALRAAGAGNLEGKVLIDVSNPLDFSLARGSDRRSRRHIGRAGNGDVSAALASNLRGAWNGKLQHRDRALRLS